MEMLSRSFRLSGIIGRKHGCFAALNDVRWASHEACGVLRNDLAEDEPIEQHPNCRQLLFNGRFRSNLRKFFDVGRNGYRFDEVQRKPPSLAPPAELADRLRVSRSRVFVSDIGREEFDESPNCLRAFSRNYLRNGLSEERRRAGLVSIGCRETLFLRHAAMLLDDFWGRQIMTHKDVMIQ